MSIYLIDYVSQLLDAVIVHVMAVVICETLKRTD